MTNVIASVLAGQGAARLLETFGVTHPAVIVLSASLTAFFISIGLFMWKGK